HRPPGTEVAPIAELAPRGSRRSRMRKTPVSAIPRNQVLCTLAHAHATGTSHHARSFPPCRRVSRIHTCAASSIAANVSGRTCERARHTSEHTTITTSGTKPRAPIFRAAAHSHANDTSAVTQRHANRPHTPKRSHTGHASALKPHVHFTSGAPYVGHDQSWVFGICRRVQIALPTTRFSQMSGS